VGREVVRLALDSGYGVAVLSRNTPPAGSASSRAGAEYFRGDVTTGEGLATALDGADVVIDCTEGQSGKALKSFADGGARLLAVAQDAGVSKAVMLSIINCDRSGFGYYQSKAAKEQAYERSGLETVAVRFSPSHRPRRRPPCSRRRWKRHRACGTASGPSADPRLPGWRSWHGRGNVPAVRPDAP
jgi:uncharacterized protein YbjT (DUF2867 family)